MPSSAPHRCFQCTLEVHGVRSPEAPEWRRRVRELWQTEFASLLDAALSRAFPASTRVRLDRLEIEVRVGPDAEPGEIGHAFRQALEERLRSTPGRQLPATPGTGGRTPGPAVDHDDWLEPWLVTGLIPWWAGGQELSGIAGRLLERLRTGSGPAWLRAILDRHPPAARRLAYQFDDPWQLAALELAWPAGAATLGAAVRRILGRPAREAADAGSPTPAGTSPVARGGLWEACWLRWTRSTSLPEAMELAARAVLAETGDAVSETFERMLREASASTLPPAGLPAPSPPVRPGPPPAPEASPGAGPTPDQTDGVSGIEAKAGDPAPSRRALSETFATAGRTAAGSSPGAAPEALASVLSPGLPVVQAGLVLLAPFLPRLFAALDIQLSPEPGRRRGVEVAPLLLHGLATGSYSAAEPELTLPKILCGLPLDEPVVCHQVFPASVQTESEELLRAVIQHWSALKQTSPGGFRDSFLRRAGILRDTGPQWQLRVEHRAWDVLLDRVPWTFRTIRQPWMLRPLMVEWEAYA